MDFAEKFIEKHLSEIGSKVVKASEMTFKAKQLTEESNHLLLEAQTEIADLYEALDDIFPKKGREPKDKKPGEDATPKG